MIGMGRTGTTILHDLLGQDPANRVPLHAGRSTGRSRHPRPRRTTPTRASTRCRRGIDLGHAARPEMQAMHPTGARLAQECVRITGCDFRSVIFGSQYHLPSYVRWVTTQADMAPAYRLHRRYLQLLGRHHRGDRWVVKSGAHLWALPASPGRVPRRLLHPDAPRPRQGRRVAVLALRVPRRDLQRRHHDRRRRRRCGPR